MAKSSSLWSESVKQRNAKLKEQLVSLLDLDVQEVILNGMNEYLRCGTKVLLELLMDAEARQRCGERYERNQTRECFRWGQEQGTAVIGGVRQKVERPRLRLLRNIHGPGGEVQLETYKAMNRAELIDGPLMASILSGVSARRYASIVSHGLQTKGVSKSAVSLKAIAATKPTVEQFLKRRIDEHKLVVLLIDGIHIANRQMLVCVGIDHNGRKHVLGVKLGPT